MLPEITVEKGVLIFSAIFFINFIIVLINFLTYLFGSAPISIYGFPPLMGQSVFVGFLQVVFTYVSLVVDGEIMEEYTGLEFYSSILLLCFNSPSITTPVYIFLPTLLACVFFKQGFFYEQLDSSCQDNAVMLWLQVGLGVFFLVLQIFFIELILTLLRFGLQVLSLIPGFIETYYIGLVVVGGVLMSPTFISSGIRLFFDEALLSKFMQDGKEIFPIINYPDFSEFADFICNLYIFNLPGLKHTLDFLAKKL